MSSPKKTPDLVPVPDAEPPKTDMPKLGPPKLSPGMDPNSRAYDPSVKLVDLTPEERRARRQARKKHEAEMNALAAQTVVKVTPMAKPAKMRGRHWGLVSSLIIFVLAPLALTFWYLEERAVDQFASTVGFTVQQENSGGAPDLLSGMAGQLGGVSGTSDTDILYEFIQSQQMVQLVNEKFDLMTMYSEHFDQDPIFSLPKDATLEELVEYWSRIMQISYDESARLIELRVLAYDPVMAQAIAREIVTQSQSLINDLNAQSRADTIRYAEIDLTAAEERLSTARSNLIRFRTRTQIVDPETDLAGRLGVVNTLQQQLAEALIEYDLLAQSTSETDQRVVQAQRRIDVIRDRLAEERANVARGENSVAGEDYPTLLAEYEELVVAREIAEQMYRASLTSLDIARADASRQSRYLAAYIAPTLPQTAEFPKRWTLFGLVALFIGLTWTIVVLIYYSVRDSR